MEGRLMGLPAPIAWLMSAMHRPVYASRLRGLVDAIVPHLEAGDRVLDVGCGNGTLGRAILDAPSCPPQVTVEGLERVVRGGEPIRVHSYDGVKMPLESGSYDVVIVADVLHHEAEPDRLLSECVRVSRRLVMIKDHQIQGIFAQQRVSFMDWAANAPYGVPCLYRYPTPQEWSQILERHDLRVVERKDRMNLYPPVVNAIFGGRLQFMAVASVPGGPACDGDPGGEVLTGEAEA
ncbi:MAG: class I SAM-dependent methyltransferase [Planctomycetota bacterium]|nr:MAG: class I SAM-dependent methyltransferase [Planctomycetota bacterium]